MALFNWSDKYSVSVAEMDNQHKELVNILNEIFDAMSERKSNEVLGKIIAKLVNYTRMHFSAEERYMQKYNYPGYAGQKREHDAFIAKIQTFQNDFNAGKLTLSLDVSSFLKNWLIQHISVEDKKYGSFFNQKGLT